MSTRMLISLATVAAAAAVVVPAFPGVAAPSGGCSYPPNKPVLTLTASSTTVVASQSLTVFGKFTQNNCGISDASLSYQRRALVNGKPSGTWHTMRTLTTNSNGSYSTTRRPLTNEQERTVFTHAGSFPTTVSNIVTIHVAEHISINPTAESACRIHITGSNYPAKADRKLLIQNRGPSGHFNGWTTLWSTTTGSGGSYSTTHTVACNKTYNLSLYTSADSTNTAGRSRTVFGIKSHH
ncbi:MAG TPA: hypothetical protein VFH54_07810 [Mycobacteriales bacterium]|nr:hypothetical protein [Mycobacteriales bacterium]